MPKAQAEHWEIVLSGINLPFPRPGRAAQAKVYGSDEGAVNSQFPHHPPAE
jgi:hypothetical protein